MYGKFIDEKFVFAPNPMTVGEYKVYNPTPENYKAEGYLEIIETEYPADNKYYVKRYTERDGAIYETWIEAEMPNILEPIPTLEERMAIAESQIIDTQLALCEVYEMLI